MILARGKVKLARMIGRKHNYITYREQRGLGLPEDEARIVSPILGLSVWTLTDKEGKTNGKRS